jgi:KDO2-lipid IV(A) lauroyltransferase
MQRFFRSSSGVNMGLWLGRIAPPSLGYKLSEFAGKMVARNKNLAMVKAVRLNQRVVLGAGASENEIQRSVEQVFTHAGRCFVDLYHHIQNPIGLKYLSVLRPDLENLISKSHDDTYGAFLVAPHMSNFDLVLLAAAYRGLKAQVLTYGHPTGGYQIQNEIRAQTGLMITPVNPEIHGQAIENMRQGGFVITAVDRPIRRKALTMKFFGRPSPLPAGHIRMALEAQVPIIVVAAEMQSDMRYRVNISEPIRLIQADDPEEQVRINGEKVLQVIEAYIRAAPNQWLMYYPVWPNLQED